MLNKMIELQRTCQLKKLKVYRAFSEETTAYTAELWINGKYFLSCRNDGHGGCDDYWIETKRKDRWTPPGYQEVSAWGLVEEMNEFIKDNFAWIKYDDVSREFVNCPKGDPNGMAQNIETLVAELLEDVEIEKEVRRIQKKYGFAVEGDIRSFSSPRNLTEDQVVAYLKNKFPDAVPLWNMPLDEAKRLYKKIELEKIW